MSRLIPRRDVMACRASHDRYAVGQCHVCPPDEVDLQVIFIIHYTISLFEIALCHQGDRGGTETHQLFVILAFLRKERV